MYHDLMRGDLIPTVSDDDIAMRLEFEISSDEITNIRSCQTFLDLLADIGGLLYICCLIAKLAWRIIFAMAGNEIN